MTSLGSDISAIKAEYEGLQGRAGPNAKVLSITPAGIWWGGRSGPLYRRYEVVVERFNGERVTKMIGVVVGLIRGGSIDELSTVRERGSPAPRSTGEKVGRALGVLGSAGIGVAIFLLLGFLPGRGATPPGWEFRFDHPIFVLSVILAVGGAAFASAGRLLIKQAQGPSERASSGSPRN